MQKFHYSSYTANNEMEIELLHSLIDNGFHARFKKTFDVVSILAVKPGAEDSQTEVENVLNDA